MPETSPDTLALADLVEGLARWQLWGLMGWQDIRQRYRRSVLGPFWLTLSMGILVGTIGILYAKLFGRAITDFLPHVALGFLAWSLISSRINEGCTTFVDAAQYIKQVKLPYSVFVYRKVWAEFIILAHNSAVYVVVAVVFAIWPGAAGLLVLPGLVLIALNAIWVGLLFGMVGARFRDVPQIVTSLMRVAFFLTPVIWKPEMLGARVGLVDLNPFYHFIELLRAPLQGQVPAALTWAVVVGVTIAGWLVTYLFFRRFRHRIPYWV